MLTESTPGEEDFGFSSATFPISLSRKAASTTTWAESLLPGVMRTLADEIERGAYNRSAPSETVHTHQLTTSADVQSVVSQVAFDLSTTLTHHLDKGFGQGTAANYAGPLESRSSLCTPHVHSVDAPVDAPGNASTVVWVAGSPGGTGGADQAAAAESRVPQLRLKLLGTPEITLDGIRLHNLERCGRASLILYILALHRRGLSGERLAAHIASDSPDLDPFDTESNLALGAVRTFIWRLRKLAGWPGLVVSTGEQGGTQNKYRLPDDTVCDLWDFERNLDEAARMDVRATFEPDVKDRAAALRQEAILKYGGEFCKGVGAGSIAHAAHYLRQRYLHAVLLQAAYWKCKAATFREARQASGIARGQRHTVQEESAWLQALGNYRLAAQAEPCDESLYTRAMLCEAHLGHVRGVEEILAHCTRVIKAELERGPLPATVRAARECMQLAASYSRLGK